MSSLASELGRAVSEARYGELQDGLSDRLILSIQDVVATMVSGSYREDVGLLRRAYALGSGPSTVIFSEGGAAPSQAALCNALGIAADQLQDGHRVAKGHPMSHLFPAIFAVGEATGSSGPQLLRALIGGYEVGVVIGNLMGGTQRGVHDIGTWATLGATAGVSYLLSDGDPRVIGASLEIAASAPMSFDAEVVFQGSPSQHLYLGLACQSAVTFGYCAYEGVVGLRGTLERFYLPRVGSGRELGSALVEVRSRLWDGSSIFDGYIKRHPTCAHLHGVNDAVEDLISRREISGEIRRIEIATYREAAVFDNPLPHNDLEARFSIPYTVAVMLIKGDLDHDAFSDHWLFSDRVRELACKVVVRHDPICDLGYPEGRPATVTIVLENGHHIQATSERPRGDGPSAQDDPVVQKKALELLSKRLPLGLAKEICQGVEHLTVGSLAPLSTALRSMTNVEWDRGSELR